MISAPSNSSSSKRRESAPALADRWRHAQRLCCCAQIAAWVRARACVRGSRCKSQPCDVILVTQEMRVRETVVSLYAHRRHSRKDERSRMGKRCVMQLPCLRPALAAAAAVQYSSICRQSAEWWRWRRRRIDGIWGASHRRDGVRHCMMHGEGAVWCRVGEV